jgi:hypothetical protein
VQAKEKDEEREKERKKNNYLPFSAAAEGEHIHTLIYMENTKKNEIKNLTRSHEK